MDHEKSLSHTQPSGDNGGQAQSRAIQVPSISLPKGGGAIKGIDEKFSVNAVNGTASLSIPLPVSPARGASPALNISYNSGAGNGIFGMGWQLNLPSIARKTDQNLPLYQDNTDSDTFLFSGAEDLVPELKKETLRGDFSIRCYKPRIEGLFARIERWTSITGNEIKWRVISRENVTTLFGWSEQSRLHDPQDESRIFQWLPEFVFDDKGNCAHYLYKKEDKKDFDATLLHNKNRQINGEITYTNIYLEQVRYGIKTPYKGINHPFPEKADYMFQTVFDYGEYETEQPFEKKSDWAFRDDPFSQYRAGFEIRTRRLCKRVLLFHHVTEYDGLVKSVEFDYDDSAQEGFTFLKSATSYGYAKQSDGNYSSKHLPPMEFTYQKHKWNSDIHTIASENLVHAPSGLDTPQYQFTDLFNEGLSGILTEQGGGWYYKHNLGNGRFEQAKPVSPKPSFTGLGRELQLADLDADGGKQIAHFGSEPKGYFELSDEEEWESFKAFESLPNIDLNDPNTRMLDLSGDGKPDILISEDNVFVWYESFGRKGYSGARKVTHSFDEEKGPHIVFSDATQSIFLADMSGDGLTDIVRIRNGEICYWPNLGYGKFGAKIGMDNAPVFDHPDTFNPTYLRIADIDGSGTPDIIYLGKDKFSCWMNLSGNSFATKPYEITSFPKIDNLSKVTVTDLLGNGVACIVWSSPLEKDAQAPLKYIDLMKSKKPHIMIGYKNNLGKEVSYTYAPSTKFYLADKQAGKPWITKLPFPVHVVEKVAVTDQWEKSRFATTYSYHHGYYDHHEREFRGFGRVEQIDVETFGKFSAGNTESPYISDDKTLYQPPVKTVTWFHTGAFLDKEHILSQFKQEYFPTWFEDANPEAVNILGGFSENDLPEPDLMQQDLTTEEWREALRACKGMTLRQEVYELDVDALEIGQQRPVKLFSSAYHNANIQRLQPRSSNRHSVFLVTESEAITYHYELDLREDNLIPDPRIEHTLNLKIDPYGHPLQSVAVVYPRIQKPNYGDILKDATLPDTDKLIKQIQQEMHLAYTETHYAKAVKEPGEPDYYRLPPPCETLTYELTGIKPKNVYFTLQELRNKKISSLLATAYHELASGTAPQKRLIEQSRILYFNKNLKDPLPLGEINHLALPYETYTLALTEELLTSVFGTKINDVLTDLENESKSGYLSSVDLSNRFPGANTAGQYWIRSGIAGFADDAADHFYLPEKYTDPFGNVTTLEFDPKDLYIKSSTDAKGNTVTVTEFDFRVLAPTQMKDINDNLSEIAFDALGMPIAMALKGKGNEADSLTGYTDNSTDFFTGAYDETISKKLLGEATARYVYDFGENVDEHGISTYANRPAGVATIVRERHKAADTPVQVAFEYSDGGGKVLVKKIQAEPEKKNGKLRWIASGMTILNNKGKPVKQYEPYFSENDQQHFEEPQKKGVTPVIYYDAPGRVVRTRFPDGSFSRVAFTPWHVATYDQNDTVLEEGNDWYTKNSAAKATKEEKRAAQLSTLHADTPTTVFLDSLGRNVVQVEHNRLKDGTNEKYVTFTKLDAEGKPLWIRDARGNVVMRYTLPKAPLNDPLKEYTPCYDIAGNLLFQHSMDGGDRWLIHDAAGKPFYAWDENERMQDDGTTIKEKRITRLVYDELHRPLKHKLKIGTNDWQITERFIYGEGQPDDKNKNLRGQLYAHYDPSGCSRQLRFDFQGNLLEEEKQLIADPKAEWIHWSSANMATALNNEVFHRNSEYDALGRMTRQYNWHTDINKAAIYKPHYNERGILKGESLTVKGNETKPISEIIYNAKGQRLSLLKGNNNSTRTRTRYDYDPLTFRLKQLRTTRPGYNPSFPDTHSTLADPNIVQQLSYTYDPVGNITEIYDEAYEPVFFKNQKVEPHSCYEYDALYRLVSASGRENIKNKAPQRKEKSLEAFPASGQALRNYRQRYVYDAVGNIMQMSHIAASGGRWTRHYQYADDSNRLLKTWIGNHKSEAINYQYDTHGNMLNLGNAPDEFLMQWDHRDMIRGVDLEGGGKAYYNYDSEKQRTRKHIERQNNSSVEERIYLDGMELYRRWKNGQPVEEIETHHLFVDEQRMLMVEDVKTTDNKKLKTGVLYRYQYSNHLGSVALELDEKAKIISYEEYHPYGTPAYQMKNSKVEASPKRYRYTGMERDDETGLNYHGARYYAACLGRWVSCDPIYLRGGINVYQYVSNSPVNTVDFDGCGDETSALIRLMTSFGLGSDEASRWFTGTGIDAMLHWFSERHPELVKLDFLLPRIKSNGSFSNGFKKMGKKSIPVVGKSSLSSGQLRENSRIYSSVNKRKFVDKMGSEKSRPINVRHRLLRGEPLYLSTPGSKFAAGAMALQVAFEAVTWWNSHLSQDVKERSKKLTSSILAAHRFFAKSVDIGKSIIRFDVILMPKGGRYYDWHEPGTYIGFYTKKELEELKKQYIAVRLRIIKVELKGTRNPKKSSVNSSNTEHSKMFAN